MGKALRSDTARCTDNTLRAAGNAPRTARTGLWTVPREEDTPALR
ncbi:hypothetical protein GCM10022222_75500 [Amycolatopsis ultiminotia]|uniref:Uncharacterized protein n=1 Tax=Amycolatopsis ultiminotia TaxID=543629 RepID=A0ABP6YB03_9PSEU